MDAKLLRDRARANLAGNWAVAIAVAAVACLLGGLMEGTLFLPQLQTRLSARDFESLKHLDFDSIHLKTGNVNHIGLVGFLLGGVIQLGYARFLLKQHDGENAEFNDLFSQFHRFGQGFAQKFLRNLYTFLWSLLFIIPGIIKGLSYAMTPYLMAENPELSAQDAIRLSIQLMEGHKGDLFWLHLTFIGWDLLAALTMNIGYLVLNPYRNAAEAAFYRQLTAADSTPEYI